MIISKEHLTQNASLAWPLVLNAILMQSMVLVDLLLVSPLGEIPIAALGIASALVALIVGIQNSIGNGTQMIIARATGAGETAKISTDLIAGFIVNMGFSLSAFIMLLLANHSLLELVSDSLAVTQDAEKYISVAMYTVVVSSVTQVLIVYFNASRKTRIPMYGFLIEIPCNAAISWVLIHGMFGVPALGLLGAALGSLIAVGIRLCYLVIRIRNEQSLNFKFGLENLTGKTLKGHLAEVSPIGANFVILSGGMTLYQMLFAQLSVYDYAAITLVFPWMRIGAQIITSWAHASAITVSQYLGQKNYADIPEFVRQVTNLAQIIAVILAVGFFLFSFVIPKIYPGMEPETLHALVLIAPVYIAMPLVRTYNTLCGNTLRAMGLAFKVLRVHVITQWAIALPLCAAAIFFGLPVYIVFGITILEECLKVLAFRKLQNEQLSTYLPA
ncbi:MATE family efflux transporter [Reinekea marinisedimentorum]|uniref:Na+-driven multidrug efflux pump n=1 Tax=Reinekea marinisedimentorum TaxID=230495 RepID=A0A4R3I9W6_9GAMM|nr:MATE family efflux transporter [Reinekea marinisedimentorum]TCS41105.1 Na+-driven multidrug efflux pump [Reinekea marinisedimentorum]